MKYATRINSFLRFDSNLLNAFQSIGAIEGVDYVDLNYPEHFADYDIEVIKAKMEECGLKCNAINLRFRDKYIGGEFGNHEPSISQDAIALCREAADACRRLGGNQMIIWLGFDGFDYSFQIDYVSYWNRIVKAFRDVYALCGGRLLRSAFAVYLVQQYLAQAHGVGMLLTVITHPCSATLAGAGEVVYIENAQL